MAGVNLQFPYEAGRSCPVFEKLIDHPSWIGRARHYLGGAAVQPYLHELFLNLRGKGGYIGCHGGGPQFTTRGEQLRSPWGAAVRREADTSHDPHAGEGTHRGHKVEWAVPYLSIIVALTSIGPGDGATVCVPSSHKSMVGHPVQQQMVTAGGDVEGAVEMHLPGVLGGCDNPCSPSTSRTALEVFIHSTLSNHGDGGGLCCLALQLVRRWSSKTR